MTGYGKVQTNKKIWIHNWSTLHTCLSKLHFWRPLSYFFWLRTLKLWELFAPATSGLERGWRSTKIFFWDMISPLLSQMSLSKHGLERIFVPNFKESIPFIHYPKYNLHYKFDLLVNWILSSMTTLKFASWLVLWSHIHLLS